GSISASSEGENRGATFVVQLPAVAVGLDATDNRRRVVFEGAPLVRREAPDLKGVRVLLVEDEPDGRELIEETLRLAGAEVSSVGSAAKAMDSLRQAVPDVLLSDIGMPEEDGFSLITRVRQLPAERGGRVPALAVSAYVREED